MIYDSETRELDFRKVSFDIAAYRHDLDSTTLEVKPFFLQWYEYQVAESHGSAPDAARAMAMEAPAAVNPLILNKSELAKLRIPDEPLSLPKNRDADRDRKNRDQARARRMVATLTLVGTITIALVIWGAGQFRESAPPEELLLESDTPIIEPDSARGNRGGNRDRTRSGSGSRSRGPTRTAANPRA